MPKSHAEQAMGKVQRQLVVQQVQRQLDHNNQQVPLQDIDHELLLVRRNIFCPVWRRLTQR